MKARLSTALLASLAIGCGGAAGAADGASLKTDEEEGLHTVQVRGATLTIDAGDVDDARHEVLRAWVERSANMVADYCGEFPVPTLRVELNVGRGRGVGYGQHFSGRLVRVNVGRDVSASDLRTDWVLPHEMLHTALPRLSRRHRWMQEGLSTYLESVVRVRSGVMGEREIWTRWHQSMRHGLPRRGDRGLDSTRTWGAVYWGGALYWMAVDVEIRHQSDGRRSLRHAVRGILSRGGNARARWSARRVVEVADEATGTTAASDLYARLALRPGSVDLDELLERLGVVERGGEIVLDDDAPLAATRREMLGAD